MSKVIVYKRAEGNVAVCYPSGETDITHVLANDVPAGAIVIDYSALPDEKYSCFFDAWELNGETVIVNLVKAREVTKSRLRSERGPLFNALDIAFQRAVEEGQDTAGIVAEKNRLRDVTKKADEATTLDDLLKLSCEKA